MNNTTIIISPNATILIDYSLYNRLYYSYCATTSLYILVGTPLCLWMASSILTSPDMRKRLRNQLICVLLCCYVLKSTVGGGLEMVFFVANFLTQNRLFRCAFLSFILYFRAVVEFSTSWFFVIVLLVFLAQVANFDPTTTLTPMVVTCSKVALLIGPFVVGTVLIPSVGALHKPVYFGDSCLLYSREHWLLFLSMDYLVPLLTAVVILILASLLYYRRFHRGLPSSSPRAVGGQLVSGGHGVDSAWAYVAVGCVDVALRLPNSLRIAEISMDINTRILFRFIAWMVIDSRSLLAPLGWLLLSDIRERLKIWRPWYRPGPGIDLTVAYSRDQADTK